MTPLVAIGLLGAAVRVAYTLALGQHVELGVSDASFYSAAANNLADGHGYTDIWRSITEGGELLGTAHHPPGWPALLSLFSLVGVESQLGHRLVGAALGGAVVVLVGVVASRIAGRTTGIVGAALAALHPTLIAADGSLMSETLAGFLLLAVLLVALAAGRRATHGRAVALGALIGAAALVRSEALQYLVLVAVPVAVVAARRAPSRRVARALRFGAGAALGIAAVVLPWTARNAVLFDRFVPISINDSTVLAGANCDRAYEGPGIGGWHVGCVRSTGGTEVEDAAAWRADGLEYLVEHRDRLPAVVGARVLRTWGLWEPLTPVAEGRHEGTQTAGNLVWLAVLLPGGIAGTVVLARRRQLLELWLVLSPVAATTVVTVAGFGMLRFRHPMELSAVVLTAVAVDAVLRRRRPRAEQEPAVIGS